MKAVPVFFMDSNKKSTGKKVNRQAVQHEDPCERDLSTHELRAAAREFDIPQFIINMIQRSADYVFLSDADGALLIVNTAACRSLGYSPEELAKMRITDIDIVHDTASWDKLFKEVRAGGSVKVETLQRNKDGDVFPVDLTINYLLHNGRELCLVVGRDVSKRKKVEEALKESEFKIVSGQLGGRTGIVHGFDRSDELV
jgi:PAS domain S-box-containing protein